MYKKCLIWIILFGLIRWSVLAADRSLPGVTIISRAQRWADESLRYSTLSKTERDKIDQQQKDEEMQLLRDTESEGTESKLWQTLQQRYQLQLANEYLIATYPQEQSSDVVRESANGKFLKWPETIHNNKKKIIIHHTAEDYSLILTWWIVAAKKKMQDIYKYHTLTRWWWDIWYNFLIDPAGNIYEWRAGWAGVVGAHAAWNNTSTIGISLMGNFMIQKPTDDQLKSLVKLTTALAKKYRINPNAQVKYFKTSTIPPYITTVSSYAVAWHKDDGQATSCPGTYLYDFLPDIRAQVAQNLWTSFTTPRVASVAKSQPYTWIPVDGIYYSETNTATFALPIRWSSVSSCIAQDSGLLITNCRSSAWNLYLSLSKQGAGGWKTVSAVTASGKQTFSFLLIRKDDLLALVASVRAKYLARRPTISSSQSSNKIRYKLLQSEIVDLLASPVRVLLYDLSQNYHRYELSCDGWCSIDADGTPYYHTRPVVETHDGFIYLSLPSFENALSVQKLRVSSRSGALIRIDNYTRKSYGGISRNVFRWSLMWQKDSIRNLSTNAFSSQAVVINELPFDDYMKGIAETSDADDIEKQKTILLLAKTYMLYYLNGKNPHPSIPAGAEYQAIDNPDMFQKYVGAWWEKTSKVSPSILPQIKNTFILYDGYVPILPYFTCSAGFTWSAREKWWWTDTPYLQSRLDFASCFDFNGHWVGLSGKWAQFLAERWWTYTQILQYYYPGVKIVDL